MASTYTASETSDTSSKQPQAQRKKTYNSKRHVSSGDLCLTYAEEKSKQPTKPIHVTVYLFQGLHRDSGLYVCLSVCACVTVRVYLCVRVCVLCHVPKFFFCTFADMPTV